MNRFMMSAAAAAILTAPALAQQAQSLEPTSQEAIRSGGTLYDEIVVVEDSSVVEPMLASEWIGQTVYSTSVEYRAPATAAEGVAATEASTTREPVGAGAPLAAPGAPGDPATPGGAPMAGAPTVGAPGAVGGWAAREEAGFRPELASIGDVTDMILDESGRVVSVVIGVGGFLGLGETWVAVPFERFTVAYDDEASWIETDLTEEELDQAVELAEELGDQDGTGLVPTGVAAGGAAVGTTEGRIEDAGEAVVVETQEVEQELERADDEIEIETEEAPEAGEGALEEAAGTTERGLEAAGEEAEQTGEAIVLEAEQVREEAENEFTAGEDSESVEIEVERVD